MSALAGNPSLGESKISLVPVVLFGAAIAYALTQNAVISIGILLLCAIWGLLPRLDGPPVLSMALSFQWVQVFAGLFYFVLTGRRVEAMLQCDCTRMMWIGAGCVLALLMGLWIGSKGANQKLSGSPHLHYLNLETSYLVAAFIALTLFAGTLRVVAWYVPMATQAILALGFGRLALFYILIRRFTKPHVNWTAVIALLSLETVIGFTGFFAYFKEGLVLTALALLERFDFRKLGDLAVIGAVGAALLAAAFAWTGIKMDVRRAYSTRSDVESIEDRLALVGGHISDWSGGGSDRFMEDADRLVDRLWQVYYPALAVERVPSMLPHTQGALLQRAVVHVLKPRMFFPNKPMIPSDSDMVRKYSGVWVAGRDRGVSIAFGYSGEMYIDFGLPMMFLPVFGYGLVMGLAYRWLITTIRVRELAVASTTVIFWLSLYLFERSTITTLGLAGTLFIVLGGATIALDRWLTQQIETGGPGVSRSTQRRDAPARAHNTHRTYTSKY